MNNIPSQDDLAKKAKEVYDYAINYYMDENRPSTTGGIGQVPDYITEGNRKEAEEKFVWVFQVFAIMGREESDAIRELEDDMRQIADNFGLSYTVTADSDLVWLDTASSSLDNWHGAMKESLVRYLAPLTTMAVNQARIAKYLSVRAGDMRRMYESRRIQTRDIANKTIPLLETASIGSDAFGWIMTALIAAGTLGTGVGQFFKAGQDALTALGSASIITGTVGAYAGVDEPKGSVVIGDKEVPLEGGSVEEVMDNMYQALVKLDEVTSEAERKLLEDFQQTLDEMQWCADNPDHEDNDLIPRPPSIIGAPRDEITTITGLTPTGYSV